MPTETAEAPAIEIPRKENPQSNERTPILTKRKARNLYLFEDATHERIASETGLTVFAVSKLISREGWVKERREREARIVKKQDARMSGIDDEIIEAIASTSEQHTMRALQRTGEALERTDRDAARDSQSYSATAKNLVGIAKILRDPVSTTEAVNFNLFFMGAPSAGPAEPQAQQAEPKNVTPKDTQTTDV